MPDTMQAIIRLYLAPCSLAAAYRSISIPWQLFTTLPRWFTFVHLLYQHPNLSLFQPVEYTKLLPAVQHQHLESPAPQDGLTNMPETPLPVDQFHMTLMPCPFLWDLWFLPWQLGFSSYQNLTTDQMTTILLKVMLLSQRTLDPLYPGVTQDTQPKHNTDGKVNLLVMVFA